MSRPERAPAAPAAPSAGDAPVLGDDVFAHFRALMAQVAGIALAPEKRALVAGRLARRLKHHGLGSYDAYRALVARDPHERQAAIDLLTTNETRFFREPAHFDLLRTRVLPELAATRPLRVWSAASSTGQEAYSIAMLLARHLGHEAWSVLGSDLSSRVLDEARRARYDMRQAAEIPTTLLHACCLRGVGAQEGTFAIAPELRQRVRFSAINLNDVLPDIGAFEVIFLRNVLIYFPAETKRQVVGRVLERLRPGGWFFVGHSESLGALAAGLEPMAPSAYRKP